MQNILVAGALGYGLVAGFTFHWLMQPIDLIDNAHTWWRWLGFSALSSALWPLLYIALGGLAAWNEINKD